MSERKRVLEWGVDFQKYEVILHLGIFNMKDSENKSNEKKQYRNARPCYILILFPSHFNNKTERANKRSLTDLLTQSLVTKESEKGSVRYSS